MILYDYTCTTCKHAWEAAQALHDLPLNLCPACGAASAQRQVGGGGGFRLRGGGWAKDGYAGGGSGGGNGRRGGDGHGD